MELKIWLRVTTFPIKLKTYKWEATSVGEKLLLDSDDPFFEPDKVSVKGISGSCYCCSIQLHVDFQYLDKLPLAKINKEHFYVFLCEQCEEDIKVLNESGIHNISYDVLWVLQEPLENEIVYLEEKNGEITSIERDDLLINLYKETEIKMNSNTSNKYLEALIEEETHEPRTKKKSKKNS